MKSALAIIGTIAGLIVAFVIIAGLSCLGMYQSAITANNEADAQWGQVENVYQRRFDLIPNLVATVKASAKFETDTFTAVSQARASVGQIKVDPKDADSVQKFAAAQQTLGTALSRLMMVQEKYPDLKANANFTTLQAQLEGSENRISTERHRYNDAVLVVNNKVTVPPTSFFANMAGIKKRELFKADEGAQKAPAVQF